MEAGKAEEEDEWEEYEEDTEAEETEVSTEQRGRIQRKTWCMGPYTVKKGLAVFRSPAGMSLTKLFLGGNNLIFPARESLVSDIQAGDGKIANLFLQCRPELTIEPHLMSTPESTPITFTMGNPMPEAALTLCQSRLDPPSLGLLDLASEH
jgi:hypothetical protein